MTNEEIMVLTYVEAGALDYEATKDNLLDVFNWSDFETNVDESRFEGDTITLYRGVKSEEWTDIDNDHVSWSLDKDVATWHATLLRGTGYLITATFPLEDFLRWIIWDDREAIEKEVLMNPRDDFYATEWVVEQVTRPEHLRVSLGEYLKLIKG